MELLLGAAARTARGPQSVGAQHVGDEPLVTIVTPVLNRAQRIQTCVSSVARQSYPSVEHVVVDGGSTDGTIDVLREYEESSGLRWISEPDDGMYDAINKGLALARGRVLAYLNSDDFYLPWSVEVAMSALATGVDIVYGDLGILRFPAEDETRFSIQTYRPFDLSYYTYVGALGQPTVFWRSTVTEKIGGFDTRFQQAGDCEYWLRAAVSGATFSHVREVLAVQVDHEATLRATRGDQLAAESAQLRRQYASVARPPRQWAAPTLQQSLRFRRDRLQFMAETLRRRPRRWPRFIGFLREHGIELMPPARALESLLPSRMRRPTAMRVDMSPFEWALQELVGSRSRLRQPSAD